MSDNKVGRPAVDKKDLFQRLKPYLQAGLSTYKACLSAKIPTSTVYYFMDKDVEFLEEVRRERQFASTVISNITLMRLQQVISKLQFNAKLTPEQKKAGEELPITSDDMDFVKWYAINNKNCSEEFGKKSELAIYDPQADIQRTLRTIEEHTTKEVDKSKKE